MIPRPAMASLGLVLLLAMVLAASEGKELVLRKAGDSVELPCHSTSGKRETFSWRRNSDRIVANPLYVVSRGKGVPTRFDSKKNLWDFGSYPLLIQRLEMKDSGTYTCEVPPNLIQEYDLQVYQLTASPESPMLQGERLRLTLETPPNQRPPPGTCVSPKKDVMRLDQDSKLSVQMDASHSGQWNCAISQGQKTLDFPLHIRVLGFPTREETVYQAEGEPAQLSFPLNVNDESLRGEISWRPLGKASSQAWASFSVDSRKVMAAKLTQEPQLQLADALPIRLALPKALPKHAGTLHLTLTLTKGRLADRQLQHTLNLVVMTMALQGSHLVCRLLGGAAPGLQLSLQLGNQSAPRISRAGTEARVARPEAGPWTCRLQDKAQTLLRAHLDVESTPWSPDQPLFLAAVVGGIAGLVIFAGLFVCCCVKCRRRRRRAERMSQIKRLLSEKKTCGCPHRLQRTQDLL